MRLMSWASSAMDSVAIQPTLCNATDSTFCHSLYAKHTAFSLFYRVSSKTLCKGSQKERKKDDQKHEGAEKRLTLFFRSLVLLIILFIYKLEEQDQDRPHNW